MKKLFLIGISHKTAPVEWRERLAIPETRLPALLKSLTGAGSVSEAVVLSTCNRVEVYAVAGEENPLDAFVRRELAGFERSAAPADGFYTLKEEAAVGHLFRVAAGMDSLVVGESEILGQVKRAYETARAAQTTGKLTNVVFQRALYVGKLARSRTGLSEGPTSAASLAVTLAQRIFGNLKETRVLILGAGKMAELSARGLLSQKVAHLTVINRTFERARELARLFRAHAEPFESLLPELARADIVLCSTGSPGYLLRGTDVAEAMRRRRGRSLFFIDIAVPRDVDPSVHKMENVYLYNIDDLETIVAESLVRRREEIDKASRLVDQKTREFSRWYRAWSSGEPMSFRHAPPVSSAGDALLTASSPTHRLPSVE